MKIMKTTLLRFLNALYKNLTIENYKIEYRSKLSMPSYLNQVLIGLLLSDGSIEKSSPTSLARLSVMFGLLHASYLLHLFNLFEPYTDSSVRTINTFNKRTNTSHTQIEFKTVSLPIFLIYYNMFYIYDDKLKNIQKLYL
jgi:LAGLIDADG DNA endonuclease family